MCSLNLSVQHIKSRQKSECRKFVKFRLLGDNLQILNRSLVFGHARRFDRSNFNQISVQRDIFYQSGTYFREQYIFI